MPQLQYRFRPINDRSKKELLYSEIFFTSPEECNDPFDSRSYYFFAPDTDRWEKTIEFAIAPNLKPMVSHLIGPIARYLASQGQLGFDDISAEGFWTGLYGSIKGPDSLLLDVVVLQLVDFLHLYTPPVGHFVSFAQTAEESLLWSHYADSHKGFCLIFAEMDGALNQHPYKRKKSIRTETPRGIAPHTSYGIPNEFPFEKIEYVDQVPEVDAFAALPERIGLTPQSEEEKKKLVLALERHYLQKHSHWSYEKETRLRLPSPIAWLLGQHYDYSVHERLFHYDSGQLTGLIFGARTSQKEKDEITEILVTLRMWYMNSPAPRKILTDLAIFEARLAKDKRQIDLVPLKLINKSNKIINNDSKFFPSTLEEWKAGAALSFDQGTARKINL